MEKGLTITVPAYNAEKYLDKCLASFVLKETEEMSRLEVIIVNDGSCDATAQVAQRYVSRYPDTFLLINKENGGHGSGINTGIANAHGRYFKVVDADDWVDTAALQKLLRLIDGFTEEDCPDVIAADFITIRDETYESIKLWPATPDPQLYGKTVSLKQGQVKECIKMHHMTIRTEILTQMGIQIDEHHFYVDMEYITYPIPYVDRVYYLKTTLYQYRLGREGQTMESAVMMRNRKRHLFVMEQLLKYYKKWEPELSVEQKQYMALCIGKMMESHFQIYLSMKTTPEVRRQLKTWDQSLRKDYPRIYAATDKKSIWLLRKTNYRLLGVGAVVYRISRK